VDRIILNFQEPGRCKRYENAQSEVSPRGTLDSKLHLVYCGFFGPQTLKREIEKKAVGRGRAISLYEQRDIEKRRGLSPSAFSVYPRGTPVPRFDFGFPKATRFVTILCFSGSLNRENI
jgi:hypothetical protein